MNRHEGEVNGVEGSSGSFSFLTLVHEPAQPPLEVPADPAAVYLSSLSTVPSRVTQESALRVVARLFGRPLDGFPWHELGPAHMAAVRGYLAQTKAPATANRMLGAVREVLRAARRLGLIGYEQLERALDFRSVKGSRLPPGRALAPAEWQLLFEAARKDRRRRRGARAAAIVALLYGAGLRRCEVVRLDLGAYDGRVLRVLGKGNKEREVPLPEGTRRALDAWIALRGTAPGPLVDRLDPPGQRLTVHAVNPIIQRLARRAGVRQFASHDGRRSFISHLLDAGASLVDVQQLVGHADPKTTEKYRRGRERAKARAAGLLNVPFA